MRLSLQAQYAICGMFDLAYNGQELPVQVRVIGARQRIPARYLEQIFQRLRRAELVRGKRGPGGGYVLARTAASISLRDIVEAVEGPLGEILGVGPPPREGHNPYRPAFLWPELASRVGETAAGLNLDDLCSEAAARGVERADAEVRMYHI